MSPQLRMRPASRDDDLDEGMPWSILPIGDNLVQRNQSTTARVGGHGKLPSDGHVTARWRS